MSIVTFGSNKQDHKSCEVVRVGMRMKNGKTRELTLFAVPLICEPLCGQPITLSVQKYNHLSQLDLADPADDKARLEIDILIGSDYYWEFTTGKTCRGENGPIVIHTTLEWVLSGPVDSPEPPQSTEAVLTMHTMRVDSHMCDTECLDARLRSFWEPEALGIHDPD